jgi:PAS domain S-box-containing protein
VIQHDWSRSGEREGIGRDSFPHWGAFDTHHQQFANEGAGDGSGTKDRAFRDMADPSHPYIEDRVGGSWIRQGPQVKSCLGYAPEDGYTPNFWKTRLHPADRDRVLAEDERCDQTLEPFRSTYRVFARDGRTVWLRDEAELVYDDSGEPSYWQGCMSTSPTTPWPSVRPPDGWLPWTSRRTPS